MIALSHYLHLTTLLFAFCVNFTSPGFFRASRAENPEGVSYAFAFAFILGDCLALLLICGLRDLCKATSWEESIFNHPKLIAFGFGIDFALFIIIFLGLKPNMIAIIAICFFLLTFSFKMAAIFILKGTHIKLKEELKSDFNM